MKVEVSIKDVIPIDTNDFCSALAPLDDGDDPLITQVVGDAQSSVLTAAVCIGAEYDCIIKIEKR